MVISKIFCLSLIVSDAAAFSSSLQMKRPALSTNLMMRKDLPSNNKAAASSTRKDFLTYTLISNVFLATASLPAGAVERAVGAAEKSCREEGNCLEKFDIDGAVGWNWGGRDRCDPTDPRCGPDGKLKDAPPEGDAVPQAVDSDGNELKITNIVQIELQIGRSEKGTIRLGLYGDVLPASVSQFAEFLGDGIVTTSKLMLENGYGVSTSPISFGTGGTLTVIYPMNRLEFGIPSQGISYAKGRSLNKIPDDFLAQPRPSGPILDSISKEKSVRQHSVAGLLSIPKNGLGSGGTGYESDDEAFASCFEITATSVPTLDKENRKVIGQVMDEQSMAFLARLASSPTKKGLKGIIPGQNAGPPLVKTTIISATIQ